jgi:hypothetical protein
VCGEETHIVIFWHTTTTSSSLSLIGISEFGLKKGGGGVFFRRKSLFVISCLKFTCVGIYNVLLYYLPKNLLLNRSKKTEKVVNQENTNTLYT